MTKGAFSQERISMRALTSANAMVINRFIIVWLLLYILSGRCSSGMRKGVSLLYELDPVASPNAVKLRSRIRSHPSVSVRLIHGSLILNLAIFRIYPYKANTLFLCQVVRIVPDGQDKYRKKIYFDKELRINQQYFIFAN